MEADMHNLVPAIGEINGDRSNFRFGMIAGERRVYGKVNMEIDFSQRVAEPPKNLYGDIARTYFYMRDRYGLKISKGQEKLLIAWNNLDPVTSWERKRNQTIKDIQGDENLYVTNYKKIEQLGKIEEPLSSNFFEIKDELAQKYNYILKHFSQPVGTIILFIITLFVLYRREKKRRR